MPRDWDSFCLPGGFRLNTPPGVRLSRFAGSAADSNRHAVRRSRLAILVKPSDDGFACAHLAPSRRRGNRRLTPRLNPGRIQPAGITKGGDHEEGGGGPQVDFGAISKL